MTVFSYNDLSYELIDSSYISIVGGNPTGTLIIPPTIIHTNIQPYPVQEISANAFSNNQHITSIDASNSNLQSIKYQAFYNSYHITSIDLSGCTSLSIIDNYAFQACFGLTSIDFTNCFELTTLGNKVFGNTNSHPSPITEYDFTYCTKLSTLGVNVFDNNQSLKTIRFGSIEPPTFNGSLGNNIGVSGEGDTIIYAYNWSNFDISFGGFDVSYQYTSYNNLTYNIVDNYSYIAITGGNTSGNLIIPANIPHKGVNYEVREISANAFRTSGITSIDASNSNLQIIKSNAFKDCHSITSVNLSNSQFLNTLETQVFYNSYHITSINFSGCSNLNIIAQMAFKDCCLNIIDFTDCNINILGYHLFDNNKNLSSIIFSQYIDPPVIFHNNFLTTDISLGGNIGINNLEPTIIYAYNWSNFDISFAGFDVTYKYRYTNIEYNIIDISYISITGGAVAGNLIIPGTIPQGTPATTYEVVEIAPNAFSNNQDITSIDASNSNLYKIKSSAFSDCSNIITVDLNNSKNLELIDPNVFINNTSLTSINFSGCSNLNIIAQMAFKDCCLNIIDFTDCNINILGYHLFDNNKNLSSIIFSQYIDPPVIFHNNFLTTDISLGGNIGINNLEPTIIYAYNWSNFDISFAGFDVTYKYRYTNIEYNIIDISYVSINGGAVAGNLIIPGTIPQGTPATTYEVREISANAFSNNQDITSIVIPMNVQQISKNTFQNCSNLMRITFLGPCPTDLNINGLSPTDTPFLKLPQDAKIYIYYQYSSTNPDNTGVGPYYLTQYKRASWIPVIIIDPPTPPCICPPKQILNNSHSSYKNGQNASKLFTRINQAKYSRVKRTIHISQSEFTNICDPNIELNININTQVTNKAYQQHLDNTIRLNNSINCHNRNRFGKFLAGLKNI